MEEEWSSSLSVASFQNAKYAAEKCDVTSQFIKGLKYWRFLKIVCLQDIGILIHLKTLNNEYSSCHISSDIEREEVKTGSKDTDRGNVEVRPHSVNKMPH